MVRTAIRVTSEMPVKVPVGGTARVRIATPGKAFADRFEFELDRPPDGISLQDVSLIPAGLEIVLRCDANKAKLGLSGNLIINLVPQANQTAAQKGKPPVNQRRPPAGALPAIPFEVVELSEAM